MGKRFLSIDEANLRGKRVLVRVDFNVPLQNGSITDDARIRESLPTLQKLTDAGASLVVCSHLGRPGGKPDPQYSLEPVARHLADLLGSPVAFAEDCIGDVARAAKGRLKPGQTLLLENLRFHKEEEANDPEFAKLLAENLDAFVNDAFGSAHRAHASTEAVARLLPSYAGYLMKKELDLLGRATGRPARPFVAVLGGAKVSGKINVIRNLLGKVDALLIGGAMAFTFARALNGRTGTSLVEGDKVALAKELLVEAKERRVDLALPSDVVVAREIKGGGPSRVVPWLEVPEGWKGVDVGPRTVEAFGERIVRAQTVLFNGPLGVFETPEFSKGTCGVLQAMASCRGTTLVGGGDSAAAAKQCGLSDAFSHVSTGGGACLEFLEGRTLPGVAALERFAATVPVSAYGAKPPQGI